MTRYLVPALLLLAACGDDSGDGDRSPDASIPIDSQVPMDSRVPDAATDGGPRSDGSADKGWSVKVSGGACFGTCPTFSVSLADEGAVKYVGGNCTVRPGVFTKQIASSTASSFYAQFAATSFLTLKDRYVQRSDGCASFHTDDRTVTWEATVDGRTKKLVHYLGCEGVPGLDEVDALEQPLITVAAVEPWIRNADGSAPCSGRGGGMLQGLAPSYLLKQGANAIGLLKIEAVTWTFNTCAGVKLAEGSAVLEQSRLIIMNSDETPLALADGLGSYGSILITKATDGTLVAKGLQNDGDVDLTISAAATCQ